MRALQKKGVLHPEVSGCLSAAEIRATVQQEGTSRRTATVSQQVRSAFLGFDLACNEKATYSFAPKIITNAVDFDRALDS